MRIFGLVQLGVLFISSGFYFITKNPIIRFYSFLVMGTVMSLMIFEILLLFIYQLYKSKSFKDRVSLVTKILLFMGVLALFAYNTIKYYKDIPYVIKGEYSVIFDECTYCYVDRGRAAHLKITIGGKEFRVSLGYKDAIRKGQTYKVEYLPNTKEVMHIYGKINR